MYTDIYNIEKFIKVNNIQQVTNPILLEKDNFPTADGLLSFDIFGRNQNDRKEIYGYIDLRGYFINPLVYRTLKKVDRKIEKLISGNGYYILDANNMLKEVDEGEGYNGIDYFYKIYDKLEFKKSDSRIRKDILLFLKGLKKNEVFTRYWIVSPPFYRDVNLQNTSSISYDQLNNLYSKLIRLTQSLTDDTSGFDFVSTSTKFRIQSVILEIYDYFIDNNIKGKNGFIRQSVLGKSIDYGARVVISAPRFNNYDRPEDSLVEFDKAGVPLHITAGIFLPFVIHYLKNFFVNEFISKENYPIMDSDGNIKYVTLDNPEYHFNEKFIETNVEKFIQSGAVRYNRIEIPLKDTKRKYYMTFKGRYYKKNVIETDIIKRPATWTDLIYIACVNITRDKHIVVTRYPVSDHFSTFPNKIEVLSTHKTIPVQISGVVYPHYPVININTDSPDKDFINTLQISNVLLNGLGGDYDGDQVSIKGLFTQEANNEADILINSKKMMLSIRGENMRTNEKELILTLYALTKN